MAADDSDPARSAAAEGWLWLGAGLLLAVVAGVLGFAWPGTRTVEHFLLVLAGYCGATGVARRGWAHGYRRAQWDRHRQDIQDGRRG